MLLHLFAELRENVRNGLEVHRQIVRVKQGVAFHPPTSATDLEHGVGHSRFDVQFLRSVFCLRRQLRTGPLLHQRGEDVFRPSLLDQQGTTRPLQGGLQIGDAFQQEPRAKRARFHMAPTVGGPKSVVQHHHGQHFIRAKRLGQGRVVVQSQVVAKPMEGA